MEVDLASHRIVRAAPGFLGLIFGPGPYKTMFGPIIHFIHPVRARRVFAGPRARSLTQPAEMDQLREWEETLAEQVGAADPSRHSRNRA